MAKATQKVPKQKAPEVFRIKPKINFKAYGLTWQYGKVYTVDKVEYDKLLPIKKENFAAFLHFLTELL